MLQKTLVWMAYNQGNLYFAFRCNDPEPDKIKTSLARRDTMWNDDWVGLSLDALGSGQSSYDLFVNPNRNTRNTGRPVFPYWRVLCSGARPFWVCLRSESRSWSKAAFFRARSRICGSSPQTALFHFCLDDVPGRLTGPGASMLTERRLPTGCIRTSVTSILRNSFFANQRFNFRRSGNKGDSPRNLNRISTEEEDP